MKNVLYFSSQKNFVGGAPRSLYGILKNLDRRKVTPHFASIHDDDFSQAIQKLGVPFLHISQKNSFTPPFFALGSVNVITKYIRDKRIDLIHNNQCDDALYSWLPAKLTNTPIIIHHRDPSFYKRHRFLMNTVDANIAISNWQNEKNLHRKGVVIHNGIDLNKFKASDSIDKNDSSKSLIVGLLGRIVFIKGQDVFIKAASLVLKKYENVQFLIIGDDQDSSSQEYIQQIKSLVKELGIEDSVSFTGYIADGLSMIPSIDISVIPSRKEPFGRVIIESMACKKPVIATNVWGALDIVTPETGLLVPPDDPEALADAILTLINSPELRWKMGEAGYRRVKENFTIDQMMKKIYQLYDAILAT